MRSRYSAYCTGDWRYILNTYAKAQRETLTEDALRESAAGTKWLYLAIVTQSNSSSPQPGLQAQVEFKAFYALKHKLYLMHETSDFVVEDNEWRYTTGVMHPDTDIVKVGRNDACFCHSGKKFKQCCLKRI
ncbi:UPF0225 protein [Alteromonas lipolytica]|nr:UPF0225 protein [Alteromonas lipolytica]